MTALSCEGISKRFDDVGVLSEVTLEFQETGVTAVIGPNGAGKTTLLNVLMGFLDADNGRCWIGDRETSGLAPHEIARLGVARTFQDLRLDLGSDVLGNVLVARPNQRGESLQGALLGLGVGAEEAENRAAALQYLEVVGLEQKICERASALSYGEQKLLTLACCLATEAKVLLLDEPVAGVHPDVISNILSLLRDLRERGRTIVFVEHDLFAVRQVADRVVVMDEGRVIADGTPSAVLRQPAIIEAYVG